MSSYEQQHKADVNAVRGDNGNFPILCESCLGENPYVRMLKDPGGAKCKMCDNPFTVFKWRPGRGEGFKRTEVCQNCSKSKNLCQTCILDLQCGLPSQLRDAVLEAEGDIIEAKSDVGRNYQNQQRMAMVANGHTDTGMTPAERLMEIARQASLQVNREQHRVRLQINPIGSGIPSHDGGLTGMKRPLESSVYGTYEYNAYDNPIVFAPGIAAAAHSVLTIPFAMRSFASVPSSALSKDQGGDLTSTEIETGVETEEVASKSKATLVTSSSSGVSGDGDSVAKKKKAKRKQVFAPHPPSGPPPPQPSSSEDAVQ